MLSLLIAHIVVTAFCLWSGALFYKFFPENNQHRNILHYLISGLILLTALTQLIALFFPINIYSKLVIFGILLLLSIHKKINVGAFITAIKFRLSLLLFLSGALVILLFNAGPIIMDDTESYHIQSIKWIQEYGSVPGLVNLHERFGFNSSWFTSVALFSFLPKTAGGYTVLNSVLSLWLCYWFILKYEQYQKENIAATFAILVVFICCLAIWPLLRGNAATTNYDFITTAIVIVLFTEVFLAKDFSPSVEWIIWPAYLFTIRIINFPLLLLSIIALLFFIKQKSFKDLYLPVVFCLLFITPFVVRNIILTGYPFYPATSYDFANVDWKPDPQNTERLLEYIKYYNRVSTTYLEIEQTKALGANWIPSWFNYLFLFDKLLVIAGIAGILMSMAKQFAQKNKNTILLLFVTLAWLTCWFIISPDPRFVYGILLFGILLLAFHFISLIKNLNIVKAAMNTIIVTMIVGLFYYFISKSWKQKEYRNWLLPATLPQPPVKEVVIDEITFRIPEPVNNNWNARCYGTKLPCLYKIEAGLKPRGKKIRDGFRLEK